MNSLLDSLGPMYWIETEGGAAVPYPDQEDVAGWTLATYGDRTLDDRTGRRRVARDQVREWELSTVFLALNHNYGPPGSPPMLYESMLFDAEGAEHGCWRYRTREAAEEGHARLLDALQVTDQIEDVEVAP